MKAEEVMAKQKVIVSSKVVSSILENNCLKFKKK